jgi:hypothetical protein
MSQEVMFSFKSDDVSFAFDEAAGPGGDAEWRMVISATASVEDDTLGDGILVIAPRPASIDEPVTVIGAMRKMGRGKFRADVLVEPSLAERLFALLTKPLEIEGEASLTLSETVDFERSAPETEASVTRVDILVHRDS